MNACSRSPRPARQSADDSSPLTVCPVVMGVTAQLDEPACVTVRMTPATLSCATRGGPVLGATVMLKEPASCGATEARRLLSQVAAPARIGLRGVAARRSDATRKAREERKREERAAKRERKG